jgi:hypothetical protein
LTTRLPQRDDRGVGDLPDYELSKTDTPVVVEHAPTRAVWIAILCVAGLATAAYFVFGRRPAAPAAVSVSAPKPVQETVGPLGGPAEPVTVPPLDESDPIVRELVRKISSNPLVLKWLTLTGLIRNLAVVLENLGEGVTPARHLGVLRPDSPFRVVERNGRLVIDPRSYERYDAIAAAADSIDAAAAARVYTTLKPRIAEAYGEVGMSPESLDGGLERAIVMLLKTPPLDDAVPVKAKGGTGYEFADPRLEGLTAAQKQLLRMGPHNMRVVQSALRRLATALGIPPARLP